MTVRDQGQITALEETWFQRALHCRVYCPDEARHIAQSHHRHAAEKRARGPSWEGQACLHDERARLCEAHAVTLGANAAAPAP